MLNTINSCVDWCQFTINDIEYDFTPQEVIEQILLLSYEDFKEVHGNNGYKKAMLFNGVSVHYDGSEGMGMNVCITGKGCRYLDSLGRFEWLDFLEYTRINLNFKYSRLDIAFDEFNNLLEMDRIRYHLTNGMVSSLFRSFEPDQGKREIKTNKKKSDTILLGKKESDTYFVIYDKRLERINAGIDVKEEFWKRFEIRLKHERANVFIEELISNKENFKNIGYLGMKVINRYIRFLSEKEDDSRLKYRINNADWWEKFVNNIGKAKLTKSKSDNSIESVKNWVEKSVSSSLKLLQKAYGNNYINYMIQKAELTEKQQAMLKEFLTKEKVE